MGGLTAVWSTRRHMVSLVIWLLAVTSVPAWAQIGPAPLTEGDAVGTFAAFIGIRPDQVRVSRSLPGPLARDTDVAAEAEHAPPSDAAWWGPRSADGTVECQFEVGRRRDTGEPYVRRAEWTNRSAVGESTIALDDVPAIAQEFLRAYCPFFRDDLVMDWFQGFPTVDSSYGMTGWSEYTPDSALQIGVDIRLDDGSVSYSCWYRTGLTPAAITEEQAKQIAEEQWRAKYPEQELVCEKATKLLESEFSPTRGPAWMVIYRRGPEGGRTGDGETEHVWLTIDAVTGAITKAPNYTPPKLTREEAETICAEQWLAKWPDEKLELVRSAVWFDCELSPSHGPVWYLPHKRTTEGALPVSSGDRGLAVCIDGLTGEILRAPNLTKPKLSETDAEQVYQAEWVTRWPGDKLGTPRITGLLDSPKSPTHGPVWVFAYQHSREGVHSYGVEVVMDALTGAILEGPDFSEGRPRQVKQ